MPAQKGDGYDAVNGMVGKNEVDPEIGRVAVALWGHPHGRGGLYWL